MKTYELVQYQEKGILYHQVVLVETDENEEEKRTVVFSTPNEHNAKMSYARRMTELTK